MITFTKQQIEHFKAYKRIQSSNRYNMLDPRARQATGLTQEQYGFVLDNYDGLAAASEQPKYFAVLEAGIIDHTKEDGEIGRYRPTERNDPAANWFRVQFHSSPSGTSAGGTNAPIGNDREQAERIIRYMNTAYRFGLDHAQHQANDPIQPGRMGHYNRNEEQMP